MSNPLKNKTFSTVIKIAAVGLMAYGVGSAVMAASAAGTGAGVGSLAAAESAGMASANAAATGSATSGGVAAGIDAGVNAGLGAATEAATTGLASGAGAAAGSGGFLSGMMSNPMVQYGLVQTGGAMLKGAMTPEAEGNTNDYNVSGYAPTNSYAPNTSDREKPAGSTMPTYNQETKRWES